GVFWFASSIWPLATTASRETPVGAAVPWRADAEAIVRSKAPPRGPLTRGQPATGNAAQLHRAPLHARDRGGADDHRPVLRRARLGDREDNRGGAERDRG